MNRLLILLLLVGCQGPEGPLGATGDQGPIGPRGEQGPPGEQGPSGNANVDTHVFILNGAAFSHSESVSTYSRDLSIITREVVESGGVFAFTDLGSRESFWYSMPVVLPATDVTVSIGYAYTVELFAVYIVSNSTNDFSDLVDGYRIRVVVVPPGANKAGVDFTDYEAVARYYGLN